MKTKAASLALAAALALQSPLLLAEGTESKSLEKRAHKSGSVPIDAGSRPTKVAEVPFGFRGLSLGMSFAEFKSVNPADVTAGSGIDDFHLICSGDKAPDGTSAARLGVSSNKYLSSIGGFECAYIHQFYGDWQKSPIVLMRGRDSKIYDFTFAPGAADEEPRLFSILLSFPSDIYDEVVSGLAAKHGKASSTVAKKVRTKGGHEFENQTFTWENSTSFIHVERYFSSINDSALILREKAISDLYDRAIEKLDRADPASQL